MIYLHGFASSPSSSKAQAFARHFSALGLEVTLPRLDEGRFEALTLSGMRALVEKESSSRRGPRILVGSSLGGYLALLHASEHPVDALVLMAPAVDFHRRLLGRHGPQALGEWEAQGFTEVDHHANGRKERLGAGFLLDARLHPPFPPVKAPLLVFQGLRDEVVPFELVEPWAREAGAEFVPLDDGHELGDSIGSILERSEHFLGRLGLIPGRG